jgi:hypothetical protein
VKGLWVTFLLSAPLPYDATATSSVGVLEPSDGKARHKVRCFADPFIRVCHGCVGLRPTGESGVTDYGPAKCHLN